MGNTQYDKYNFKSTPSWKILYTSFLNMDLFTLVTGNSLLWHILVSGCGYIYIGLASKVDNVPFKRNSYLLNKLWIIAGYFYDKYLLSDATLRRSVFCVSI